MTEFLPRRSAGRHFFYSHSVCYSSPIHLPFSLSFFPFLLYCYFHHFSLISLPSFFGTSHFLISPSSFFLPLPFVPLLFSLLLLSFLLSSYFLFPLLYYFFSNPVFSFILLSSSSLSSSSCLLPIYSYLFSFFPFPFL